MFGRKFIAYMGASVVALALGASARANTITLDLVSAPAPVAGGFQYTYSVQESNLSTIVPGSQFTIFDVFGLVGVPVYTPIAGTPNFTISVANAGPSYGEEAGPIADNPAVPNVTGTSTGTFTQPAFGPTQIGTLTLVSTSNVVTGKTTGSFDIATNGQPVNNQATTAGPGAPGVVPLPAAVWGGIALFGLMGGRRMLGRREPTVV